MSKSLNDPEFIKYWNETGGAVEEMARVLKMNTSALYQRARRLEKRGAVLTRKRGVMFQVPPKMYINHAKARILTKVENGVVIVGSDAHIWPGEKTTAVRAFLKLIQELKPKQVHMNGDVFDGAKVSRHPKIGFLENAPEVRDEITACRDALKEIEEVSKGADKFWEFGNHDLRYEALLAAHAGQYEGLQGFHLKDWFPKWTPCWGVHINPDEPGHTVVKHRFKGGKYDVANNVMNAQVSMITGHTHALKWWPMSTYKKHVTYGVNTGTLADPYSEQFVHYTEDNPVDWRSGFAVLTFWKGILLPPELCQVIEEGLVVFRGGVIRV